tara:strand:- start:196 stop:513 length:318 start_codon:yes stop_codon:yes gene_type:complete
MRNLLILLLIPLAGCMTLSVNGQMEDGSDSFTGSATGYMSGGGNLTIKTKKGITCEGNFVYVSRRHGEGIFTCEDGRSGPFQFVSTGGTGTGRLGNSNFTFRFGF